MWKIDRVRQQRESLELQNAAHNQAEFAESACRAERCAQDDEGLHALFEVE
jgi:hypothetical protein